MGLLDDILGQVSKQVGGTQSGQGDLIGTLVKSLGGQGGPGGIGGLAGLVTLFNNAGLGPIIQSWISTGQNLPINAQQLQQVLGHGPLQQMAQQAGMDPGALAQQLTQVLPHVVDQMTPGGTVPGGDMLGGAMDLLKKML